MKNFSETHGLSLPLLVLRLRALILALGESASPVWWKTEIMNETGFRFLERIYPRTFFQAAVHSAGEAATYTHDRAVGRIGVYHIFKLPELMEAEINRILPNHDEEFIREFRAALGHRDKLMELLRSLCGGMEMDGASGAKRLGTDKDIRTDVGVEKMAAIYYHAFAKGKMSFPYFTSE